jgi:activating signal cointegrator complex subunit 3
MVEKALEDLEESGCILMIDEMKVAPTALGRIASHYYLSHKTMNTFNERLFFGQMDESIPNVYVSKLLRILCDSNEYSELAVRHNEDIQNKDLEAQLPIFTNEPRLESPLLKYDSPHLKAFLLLQAHLCRFADFASPDYVTDKITVLDQAIRVNQALIDTCVCKGFLDITIKSIELLQCIKQAIWPTDNSLLQLPHLTLKIISFLSASLQQDSMKISDLELLNKELFAEILHNASMSKKSIRDIIRVVKSIPFYEVNFHIDNAKCVKGTWMIDPDSTNTLNVTIKTRSSNPEIHCPFFPKAQSVGWFFILGNSAHDKLLALKRILPDKNTRDVYNCSIKFQADASIPFEYSLSLYCMCDGYFGLDKKLIVKLLNKPPKD